MCQQASKRIALEKMAGELLAGDSTEISLPTRQDFEGSIQALSTKIGVFKAAIERHAQELNLAENEASDAVFNAAIPDTAG